MLDLLRAAAAGAVVAVGLHVDQVHHALQLVLGADRDLGGDHVRAEGLLERLEGAEEVRALAVEHVHEDQPGETQIGGALPEAVGAHLHAHHAVDHEHGALADAQGGQGVRDEAGLAGRVDQVDLAVLPPEGGEAGGDRHLARLLVGRGIRHRAAVGDGAEPVDRAPLEQQRLVQRGLAAPPVAHQGHVADPLCTVVRHAGSSPRVFGKPMGSLRPRQGCRASERRCRRR